jgi:hypothetical protein
MGRSSRLWAIAAAVLLVLLGGAYTAYWTIAAGRLKGGAAEWAEAMRGQGLDATWQAARVGGFPFSFRLELSDLRLRGTAPAGDFDLHAAAVSGTAGPFDFRDWIVSAPQGLEAGLTQRQVAVGDIAAAAASGAVSAVEAGVTRVWLTLQDAKGGPATDPGLKLAAATANFWLSLPGQRAPTESDRGVAFAADLHELTVPALPPAAAGAIDEVGFGATLIGPIPAAPPRQAAEAWRQAGGTIEVDHLDAAWHGLRVAASGTLALDNQLQPIGAFSGGIEGYEQLLVLLGASGVLRLGDATIARVALGVLARPGPDGKPRVETAFTIQNGQMYLGPVKLGPAPHINW